MKKRIFINIHYLEIGGAERALLGLLNALDPAKVHVDLFINQHTGDFMRYIPPYVNLLPEQKKYSVIEKPIKEALLQGQLSVVLRRLIAKKKSSAYHESLPDNFKGYDCSQFQYVLSEVEPTLPDLHHFGEYDLAISFLQPHNIVLSKVKAKKKICWIHTDYSTIHVNKELELPIWNGYDHIVSISEECTRAFLKTFPELKSKIICIENIMSAAMVKAQSEEFLPETEMPDIPGEIRILSIGRYVFPKRFEEVARMCRIMLDAGARFKWYIIGFGDDTLIRQTIKDFDVADTMILLGKKENPYPYIKRCHLYVQPSRYEGKSVTVREAQMLCKPVAITNYPTASSQVKDGVDGKILPFETDEAARALAIFMSDKPSQEIIISHLTMNDFGNESEVEKIYSLL